MISFQEAKTIINKNIFQLRPEKVDLVQAGGRVLAQDIMASFPSPIFDNSAMDGFAVRFEDTQGASVKNPVTLKMVSISSAGTPSNMFLNPGECIQCMTGAQIPEGANSIVMVEDSSGFSDSDTVQIMIETSKGKHIRKMGEEIQNGESLIENGRTLSPSEIGAIATFGYGEIVVSKKPKVAIFGTGDELIEPGEDLGEGQIYNSNLYVFKELVDKVGGEVLMQDVIKDDKNSLRDFLSRALETCDIIISSGGVSMGRYDYVRDVFIELGVIEHFWKVAQKPGKPLFFGTGDSALIFGLPGNPVSSYIGFIEWVYPVIETMMGKQETKKVKAILKAPFPREKMKHRFLFGEVWIEDGQLVCQPSKKVGSHMLSSSLQANCILGAMEADSPLQPGESIEINLLPWKAIK